MKPLIAMEQAEFTPSDLTNLEECTEESVYAPGYIQPHGVLLTLQEPHLKILQVSENVEQFFGLAATALLGKSLDQLFSRDQVKRIKMAQRTQLSCCLIFVDVDGLKQINNTLGHQVGDRVIVNAAQLLKQTFRDADIIARLGGDEFAILIPACSDAVDVLCLRLQTNIDQFNQAVARSYQLAMSVGVQICALTDDPSLEQLLA